MIEGGRPGCPECDGEGETYFYWGNDARRLLHMDWCYCGQCFPTSACDFGAFDFHPEWKRVDADEFDRLRKEGYQEYGVG